MREIRFIIHRLKRKSKEKTLSTAELIEQKALERMMSLAQEKTRGEICRDCLDRRCLTGAECKAFDLLSKTFAWEIIAASAELN